MARADTCMLDGKCVAVAEALQLRDSAQRHGTDVPDFRCSQCGKPVHPHQSSQYGGAHFEHRRRNPECSLSDPAR